MRCRSIRHQKNPVSGLWTPYPCGTCTPCGINKSSAWQFRNLMEYQVMPSASFWTLTIADTSNALENRTPRQLIRQFFDALRAAESRHGNSNQIRYFGCSEFGTTYGRLHFHMLIYGLVHHYIAPTPFHPLQPKIDRPRHHIGPWPHGHIDSAEYNQTTVRYTTDYLLKAKQQGSELFATRRPAIGSTGLRRYAALIASKHPTLPIGPISFTHKEKTFYGDNWLRTSFNKFYIESGGRFTDLPTPLDKKLQALQNEQIMAQAPPYHQKRIDDRIREIELRIRTSEEKAAQTEAAVEKRYNAIIASKNQPQGLPSCPF